MSSRILKVDATIEPLPWRAQPHSGSAHSNDHHVPESAQQHHTGQSQDPGSDSPSIPDEALASYHNPADEARIRTLESHVQLLERRLQDDTRAARDQGHQAGSAEGVQSGMQQEAGKWSDALARLSRSIEEMSKSKARFRAEVEEDAVKLALAIARKILNRELNSDPEALVGLARVALDKLNLRELQRVRVHPADAPAIEKMLTASAAPKRVEVIPDGTLERGGAVFETDRGMLDASVTTQLREIERGLADMLEGASK